MKPRKEDLYHMDKLLEMYLQDELGHFGTLQIQIKLGIDDGYARFLRDKISDLNYELSFFPVDVTSCGDFYPLEDGKFLIGRFLEDGGCINHFEETFSRAEIEDISSKLDDLVTGQICLAHGQFELNEQLSAILPELKAWLTTQPKKVWKSLLRDAVLSAGISLAINSENLESLVESVEKSIGV